MREQPIQIAVDTARIIYENVDNETLIIDTETGVYHVLRDSGAAIWQLITQGIEKTAITTQLAQHYGLAVTDLAPTVQTFLHELEAARLVTLHAVTSSGEPALALTAQGGPVAPFVPPALHTFSDMHDLLLIDPIHKADQPFSLPHTPVYAA